MRMSSAFMGRPGAYRLTFQGVAAADAGSLAELMASEPALLLSWEHPKTEFLAYFHAAAVSRGDRSALLPGASGSGKSTLTAYLAGHDFAYLGDDLIAMARAARKGQPFPMCFFTVPRKGGSAGTRLADMERLGRPIQPVTKPVASWVKSQQGMIQPG